MLAIKAVFQFKYWVLKSNEFLKYSNLLLFGSIKMPIVVSITIKAFYALLN